MQAKLLTALPQSTGQWQYAADTFAGRIWPKIDKMHCPCNHMYLISVLPSLSGPIFKFFLNDNF